MPLPVYSSAGDEKKARDTHAEEVITREERHIREGAPEREGEGYGIGCEEGGEGCSDYGKEG
jgi:hypothetical protein